MEREAYYDPLFDLQPEDFLYTPEPIQLPEESESIPLSRKHLREFTQGDRCIKEIRGWNPEFDFSSRNGHSNIISGWLKGQHYVLVYDPGYVSKWHLEPE
jgi:hypothetical protein